MGELFPDVFPQLGVQTGKKMVRIRNRTGGTLLRGHLAMFDMRRLIADNFKEGHPDSTMVNVIVPVAGDANLGFYCIAAEEIGPDQFGLAFIWGDVDVLYTGNDPLAHGAAAGSNAAATLMDATSLPAARKVLGISLEGTATKAAGTPMRTIFNGIYGIGKG